MPLLKRFGTVPLIEMTERGLYCELGDFYIDPHRSVDRAVVTHAHSDHARKGSRLYICESSGIGLLKSRLGHHIHVEGRAYREIFDLGGVKVSFHSAGHILGSAQVRIQNGPEVWLVSGDYKRESDPSCEPFEVVECDTFITEATFGTPKYFWKKDQDYGKQIHDWWMNNAKTGKNSILFGYSLGKGQRILAELAPFATQPIIIHPTMVELTQCYRDQGRKLAPTQNLESLDPIRNLKGELILAPPSILKMDGLTRFGEFETAFASGWMQGSTFGKNQVHGRSYDHGFVISDHADWNDLNLTIDQTQAKRVFVLHRNQGALVRHLRKRGLEAYPATDLIPGNYDKINQVNLSLF